jgi:hypothetical protein
MPARTLYHQIHRRHLEGEEVNSILFVGFIATIAYTFPYAIWGNVLWYLPLPDKQVYMDSLLWVIAINLYIALFWKVIYRLTKDQVYNWMFCCYLFGIYELFIVWDKPWFKFIGIPMTSNTLVFFGFAYAYIRNNWVRYIR